MIKHWFLVLGVALAVLYGTLVWFYGDLFWFMPRDRISALAPEWFEECPVDTIHFGCVSGNDLTGTVDLRGGIFNDYEDNKVSHFGTMQHWPLSPQQLASTEQLLNAHLSGEKPSYEWYNFGNTFYIALWKDGSRHIYEYPQRNLPPEVRDFLDEIDPALLGDISMNSQDSPWWRWWHRLFSDSHRKHHQPH